MDWEMFWRLSTFFPPNTDLDPVSYAIGAFGTATLGIVLLLAYWYCFIARGMGLNRMILVTLLAFLLAPSWLMSSTHLSSSRLRFSRPGGWEGPGAGWLGCSGLCRSLFAIVRVQIDRFLWLLYRNVWGPAAKAIAVTAKTGFSGQFVPWSNLSEEHVHHSGTGGWLQCALPGGILLAASSKHPSLPPSASHRNPDDEVASSSRLRQPGRAVR